MCVCACSNICIFVWFLCIVCYCKTENFNLVCYLCGSALPFIYCHLFLQTPFPHWFKVNDVILIPTTWNNYNNFPPPPSLNQPLEESLQYEKKTFHFTLIVKPSRDLKNPNSKAINFDHADTTYLFIAM